MNKIRTASLALAIAVSSLAYPVQAAEKLPVVASFSILGDVVGQVGGDRVAIKAIVGPGGDAHVYQPTPADAAGIAKAAVVFVNGLGFEGWIDRLIQTSGYKGPVITASAGIKALKSDEHEEDSDHKEAHEEHERHDDEGKEAGHHHGDLDPHAWQNVKNVIVYVKNVKEGLCKVDAANCDTYTRNAANYAGKLEALDVDIRRRLNAVSADKRKIITSHDAFRYFADAYGVSILAPVGFSTQSEASAEDVAQLINQIRKDGVRALFVENISDPRLIEQIARETGVKVGGELFSDALSKEGGPAANYINMMRHNSELMAGALVGS